MSKKPEVVQIRLPLNNGEYRTKLYKGFRKNGMPSDYEDVIVFSPGWLGSGTLHFAASALARQGHDVAVVSHNKTSILHPNKDRSKHVHFTAKAASIATGKQGVILLGHSNGNQDNMHAATEAIDRQLEDPQNPKLYHIRAISSIAGAGLSGKRLNGTMLYREMKGTAHEFIDHPIEELDVVGRSINNFISHPVLSVIEGIGAACCDVRHKAGRIINTEPLRSFTETYLDEDGIIPQPADRTDYTVLDGSHMTPVTDSDTIIKIADSMYSYNNPKDLQLAKFHKAA